MSLIDNMKERIKNSGASKKEVLYFAADSKHRIRFIEELDQGNEFVFHSSYTRGIHCLCQEELGKSCSLCNDDDLQTLTYYAFNVFDYDVNDVRILLFKATGVSPIPAFIEYFDNYGTIMDRDYIVKKNGKGVSSSFVVTPCDREKFKNTKVKPYTKNQLLKILNKAYPVPADYVNDVDDEDDDEEEVVRTQKKRTAKKEKTLQDKFEELTKSQLREIAISLGMPKREIKAAEDNGELVDVLFSDYDEEDLQDNYDEVVESEEE